LARPDPIAAGDRLPARIHAAPARAATGQRGAGDGKAAVIEIDGAHGEGGGQLVRTAVALAAVKGIPIHVVNVRARRRNAGLAAQHVAAIRAVASMCDARCEGVQPRSAAFSFAPRQLRGGRFRVDVGTAGSITLVLQAMLPAAVASGEHCAISVTGGTDVPAAPPADYLRLVLLPLLAEMGVRATLAVERRGYYPRGGGELRLELAPVASLAPFAVDAPGPLDHVEVHAHVSQLPREIAERMAGAALQALPAGLPVDTRIEVHEADRSAGPGGAIVLRAPTARTVLGSAQVAQRGVRAERLGRLAGEGLARDLRAGATLDVHAADQMPVFMALARGESRLRVREVSSHAATAIWLIERLGGRRFAATPDGAGVRLRVLG
jgi:RNA 3'-terminal phosphate cyclase (ATP)